MFPEELNFIHQQDKTVFLKSGFIYIVCKKPSRAVVGAYSSEEMADKLISELGGKKYFRKQRITLDNDRYIKEDG